MAARISFKSLITSIDFLTSYWYRLDYYNFSLWILLWLVIWWSKFPNKPPISNLHYWAFKRHRIWRGNPICCWICLHNMKKGFVVSIFRTHVSEMGVPYHLYFMVEGLSHGRAPLAVCSSDCWFHIKFNRFPAQSSHKLLTQVIGGQYPFCASDVSFHSFHRKHEI